VKVWTALARFDEGDPNSKYCRWVPLVLAPGWAADGAVMYGWRVGEPAPVSTRLATPNHPYTRGLLACLPGRSGSGRLVDIPGTVPPLGQLPTGCPFAPRCPEVEPACEAAVPPLVAVRPEHGSRCIHAVPSEGAL